MFQRLPRRVLTTLLATLAFGTLPQITATSSIAHAATTRSVQVECWSATYTTTNLSTEPVMMVVANPGDTIVFTTNSPRSQQCTDSNFSPTSDIGSGFFSSTPAGSGGVANSLPTTLSTTPNTFSYTISATAAVGEYTGLLSVYGITSSINYGKRISFKIIDPTTTIPLTVSWNCSTFYDANGNVIPSPGTGVPTRYVPITAAQRNVFASLNVPAAGCQSPWRSSNLIPGMNNNFYYRADSSIYISYYYRTGQGQVYYGLIAPDATTNQPAALGVTTATLSGTVTEHAVVPAGGLPTQSTISFCMSTSPTVNASGALTCDVPTPWNAGEATKTPATTGLTQYSSPNVAGPAIRVVTGLSQNTNYYYQIIGTNQAGATTYGNVVSITTLRPPPDAPTAVNAVEVNGQAIVSFTPAPDNGSDPVTSYKVTAADSNGNILATVFTVGTSSPITFGSGLGYGNTYSFKVQALTANSTSAYSLKSNNLLMKAPAVPGATGVPTVSVNPASLPSKPSTEFTVAFTAPTNSGSDPITSYTAQAFIGGVATAFIVTGTSSPIVVSIPSDVASPGSYSFKVYATNIVGNGPATASTSTTVGSSVLQGPPVKPTINSVAVASPTSATINFSLLDPPSLATTGNLAVSSYTATATIGGVATALTASGTTSPLTITGLTTGVTYQIDLRATTAGGTSGQNLSSTFTPVLATVPSAPTGVTVAKNSTLGQAVVSFTAPADPNFAPVTSYTITATGNNGIPIVETGTAASIISGGAGTFTFTGLSTTGGPYTFKVAAVNSVGTGASASPTSQYVMPQVPAAPVVVMTNVNPVVVLNQYVQFQKVVPASTDYPITKYTITYHVRKTARTVASPVDYSYDVVSPTCNGSGLCTETLTSTNMSAMQKTTPSYLSIDLYPYESVTVTATSVAGTSLPSNSVPLVPGKGGRVYVLPGDGELHVFPDYEGNSASPTSTTVYAYTVDPTWSYELAPDTATPTANLAGSCNVLITASSCTISGLTNGTSYFIYTRHFNSSGGGFLGNSGGSTWIPAGASAGSTIPTNSKTKSPLNLYAVGRVSGSNGVADLTWNLPTIPGYTDSTLSAAINTYTITAYPDSGSSTTTTITTGGAITTSYTWNLGAGAIGKRYYFTISAHSTGYTYSGVTVGAGDSADSDQSNTVLVAGAPAQPSAPLVTWGGTTASLSFTAPASNGSAIVSYGFTATPYGGGTSISQGYASTTSPFVFTGLDASKTYLFTMTATNEIGSSISSVASVVTPVTLVIKPAAVNVAMGSNSVTYSPTYKVGGVTVDPAQNNTGWVAPVCGTTPAFANTTLVGTYDISCQLTGAVLGTLFNAVTYETSTLTVVLGAPTPPTSVSATLANGKAVVSFTPPSIVGSSAIVPSGYTVTTYVNGFATSQTTTGSSSPITVSGLTPGLSYSFVVTATNSSFTSLNSTPSTPTVLGKTTLYVTPNNSNAAKGSPTASFTKIYLLDSTDTNTAITPNVGNLGWVDPVCGITPAYDSSTAIGQYPITCSGGNGGALYILDYSNTATLGVVLGATIPSTPLTVTVSSVATYTASITYVAPTIGAPITSYTIQAVPSPSGTTVTTTSTTTSASLSGLAPSTNYVVKVFAINTTGSSLPAMASLMTTAAPAPSGGGYTAPVTPATPVAPVPPVAPVTPVEPPVNPFTQTPTASAPSGNSVLLDGSTERVVIARKVDINAVTVTGNGWNLLINTVDAKGNRIPVETGPVLNAVANTKIEVSGQGFAANSSVAIYVFSKPTLLGTLTASALGEFYGTQLIPINLSTGEHFIQVVGYAKDGKVRTASLKLLVKAEPVATQTMTESASLSVYFASSSSKIDKKSAARVKAFVKMINQHKGPFTVKVVGMVSNTKKNPIPVPVLSKARAVALAKQLKAAGLNGAYTIIAGGLSKGRTWLNRYATVTVTWTATL